MLLALAVSNMLLASTIDSMLLASEVSDMLSALAIVSQRLAVSSVILPDVILIDIHVIQSRDVPVLPLMSSLTTLSFS
jgi:hypothetical protein